jgi:hypothetical protein
MTLDPQKLKSLRDKWQETDQDERAGDGRIGSEFRSLVRELGEMGLDLAQDATYELLEDGLTRAEFGRRYAVAAVRETMNQYFFAVSTTNNDYLGVVNRRRVGALGHLSDRVMPWMESVLDGGALPAGLTALEQQQITMLRAAKADGTMNADIRMSAVRAAHDCFRMAWMSKGVVLKARPDDNDFRAMKDGLREAEEGLKMMDIAGPYYKAARIPVEYGYRGLDKNGAHELCSREALREMRRFFLVKELGAKFRNALQWQDKGHFVLDSSGGGFGAMVMPMQDILKKLEEYRQDIRAPETYKAIGTDIDTFWQAYRRERAEVAKNDQYKLMKPEYKR